MPNPGFKDTEATFQNNSNNEIDWCEIARERISLGERIGAELIGVAFHGRLSLENGNIADCIVKTTKGNPFICLRNENDAWRFTECPVNYGVSHSVFRMERQIISRNMDRPFSPVREVRFFRVGHLWPPRDVVHSGKNLSSVFQSRYPPCA